MKPDRLLYLSAHQMTAYRIHAGEPVREQTFATTESGYAEFASYLEQQGNSVFSLLVNVPEEGFQIETIPFLQGKDRRALIARKLAQFFFTARLTAALSLGHARTRRRNERVMLCALTNNDYFAPWLKAIAEREIALAGIHSLPLLAPSFLKKQHLEDTHCLLLTLQDRSIRQSYIGKGELHFSRLSPLHDEHAEAMAHACYAETLKLQQYLTSQRLIEHQQPLTTFVLAHRSAWPTLQKLCTDSETIHYVLLDIDACARKIGLATPLRDSFCEPVFLHQIATAPPAVQFADPGLRHSYHLRRVDAVLYRIGAFFLALAVLCSEKLLFDTFSLAREGDRLQNEALLDRQRYAEIVKTFPSIPLDNESLRRVIDRHAELEEKSSSPTPIYHEISRALQKNPPVEIDRIEWKIGQSTPPNNSGRQPFAATTGQDEEHTAVYGHLQLPSAAHPRQILNALDAFVAALKSRGDLRVEVLQRPFDIESAKPLKGDDTTMQDNKPRTFIVRLLRKSGS